MRRPCIAGNWKMFTTPVEGAALARAVREQTNDASQVDIVLFPPFLSLPGAIDATSGSAILVGAQNCHFEKDGAFTGEVAVGMAAAAGRKIILVGHSELGASLVRQTTSFGRKPMR